MKFSWDEKHFQLLNNFIARNNPQTALINIRKKRIAEKKIQPEVTVDGSNNKIQTQDN